MNNLIGKLLRRNIEDLLVRVKLQRFIPDGLSQMCFTKAYISIYDQRVECCTARFFRDRHAGIPGETVTFSFDEIIKGVLDVQIGVRLHFLQTRKYKWEIGRASCRERV